MPLQLNFRVEDRGGVMFVVRSGRNPGDPEQITIASAAEVELWNALASRLATPHRESYIRVSEQDMVQILLERDTLKRQLADLHRSYDELHARLSAHLGPEAGPKCRVCGMPATHRTVTAGSPFFFCDVHVADIRTPTESLPPPSTKEPG